MELVVPARFCGPPESGNGGWTSGHLARQVETTPELPAVTVRLRTPPPLDRPMTVRPSAADGDGTGDGAGAGAGGAQGVDLVDGEHLVAQAWPDRGPGPEGVPAPVPFEVATAAGSHFEGLDDHPFPTCFSCGTGRTPGDGLCLRPGRVDTGDTYACAWVPGADVDEETVWAALDCPGGWASGIAGRPMVLGTMTARIDGLPTPGAPHVVMAWQRGEQGRKHLSGTALYTADGRLLAQAEATWIAVDPTTVRPAGATR